MTGQSDDRARNHPERCRRCDRRGVNCYLCGARRLKRLFEGELESLRIFCIAGSISGRLLLVRRPSEGELEPLRIFCIEGSSTG